MAANRATYALQLPRAVPIDALKITSPGGPQPYILQLPSRQPGRTIPLYIFVPHVAFPHPKAKTLAPTPHVFPCVMDYHGGGFYLGSCLEQAPFCAKLCRELQAIIIGVDYRMAPLDKFPAAIEDAEDTCAAVLHPNAPGYSALRESIAEYLRGKWYLTLGSEKERKSGKVSMPPQPDIDLDVTRIAFSGASSGGNIALNMAVSVPATLGLPEWPSLIPPQYATQIPLLLLYPSLDLRQLPSERFRHERMPPVNEHKRLDIDDHLAATYVDREMAAHPRASPGLVDVSTGLHPKAKTLLILSGIDTLWEQSKLWCERVEREGRSADMKCMRYEDRKHGWTTIPEIALSAIERKTRLEVLDECVRFTRAAWAGKDPIKAMEGNVITPGKSDASDQVEEEGDDAPEQDKALAALLDMGFPAHMAQTALSESGGDLEAAMEWLAQHGKEETLGKKENTVS